MLRLIGADFLFNLDQAEYPIQLATSTQAELLENQSVWLQTKETTHAIFSVPDGIFNAGNSCHG